MAFFPFIFFFFPCPSLELCAVSFVTASSAGLELGRGELFQQSSADSGKLGSLSFASAAVVQVWFVAVLNTQLPSVIKVTQAVNLQDKVYQFHLGEVVFNSWQWRFCKAVSRSINICWMPVVVAGLLRTDWNFSTWELELLTTEFFSLLVQRYRQSLSISNWGGF